MMTNDGDGASGTRPAAAAFRKKPLPMIVMVVDDDQEWRVTVAEILELSGHYVIEASNGEEALSLLRGSKVDVLLTDLAMPGLNGMTLLKELQRMDGERPRRIGVMTGVPTMMSEATLNSVRALGAEEVLVKPFPMEKLLQFVGSEGRPAEYERDGKRR